jgi:arylsulfatase A-like enzyme
MSDTNDNLLKDIRAYELPGLDLGGDLITPNYEGRSILNIPASICQLLGAPTFGMRVLRPEILEPLGKEKRRVILILMDALALHRFKQWLASGELPVWERLLENGSLAAITSISPSTTSAAITTLWTGQPAARHGVMGYEMWLKEYGMVANMIQHKPFTFHGDVGSLSKAGFEPESFLPVPTLGAHLKAHGVETYAFQHYSIAHSGLSRSLMQGVDIHSFNTPADLWVSARQLLEAKQKEKFYAWVYWSPVDTLSHIHGPDDERAAAEFINFSQALERNFLSQLSAEARRDTLLLLAADHGQITTPKDSHYDLSNHEGLLRRLHIKPTGENRLVYLHIRPGQTEAVREYIERTWPNQFLMLESGYALNAGLFGPGEQHERIADRMGDLLLISMGNAYLWWSAQENPLLGRHGGLHEQEMLVPFLGANL